MIKNKEEVRNFIYNYMDCTISNPEKALGFINYYTFDKDKINRDEEKIFKFFLDNFDVDNVCLTYNSMLYNKGKFKWLEIEDIYDVMLLDELLAFAIASGVFVEDLRLRYSKDPIIYFYSSILNEDPENLENYSEDEYLRIIRKIIMNFRMRVNVDKVYEYKTKSCEKEEFNDEEKRDLLLYWWDSTMDSDDFTDEREIFTELLNSDYLNNLSSFIVGCNFVELYASHIGELIRKGELIASTQLFNGTFFISPFMKEFQNKEKKNFFQELYKKSQKKKRLQ